jgi:hypothetical protein
MRSITIGLFAVSLIVGSPWRSAFAEDWTASGDAEATALRAKQLVASGASADGLSIAQRVIDQNDSVPAWVRQVALEAALKASAQMKDLDREARYALLLHAITTASYPEDKRRYVRPAWLDAICDRYDQKNGVGRCALLSLKLTGQPTLKDRASSKHVRSLKDEDVAHAHRDYLPLIHDCVSVAAKADPDRFDNGSVDVSWGIDTNGRAVDVEIAPRRMREAAGGCIEERLSWFRYPKSDSPELRSVSISFELTSVIRTELVSVP